MISIGIEIDNGDVPSTSKAAALPFKKGHRRAWSMPNAKGEKMTVAVIHDNHEEGGNQHRRRIVKYKLHPQRRGHEDGKHLRFVTAGHDAEIHLDHSDDDDELEVEINEEEVIIPSETGEGPRAVIKRVRENSSEIIAKLQQKKAKNAAINVNWRQFCFKQIM